MNKKQQLLYVLNLLLFPGVIIHEIAHIIMVVLIPNSSLINISLSVNDQSFVEYNMPTTATQCLLIAIAPTYINTALSLLIIDYISAISIVDLTSLLVFISLYYISVVSLSTAIPSTKDAYSPIKHIRKKWSLRRLPLMIIFTPFIVTFTIPIYIISKIIEESIIIYYTLPFILSIIIIYLIIYHPDVIQIDNIAKNIYTVWDYIQSNVK